MKIVSQASQHRIDQIAIAISNMVYDENGKAIDQERFQALCKESDEQ